MRDKDARRAAAIKRARQRRLTLVGVGAVVLTLFVVMLLFTILREDTSRVFVSAGNNTITLNNDGTFVAHLPHSVRISGTFLETEINDTIMISFISARGTENGTLVDGRLRIPTAWEDGCGHGNVFVLR